MRVLPNIFLSILVPALLAACVTTTEGGFTEKYSPEQALNERVELAR